MRPWEPNKSGRQFPISWGNRAGGFSSHRETGFVGLNGSLPRAAGGLPRAANRFSRAASQLSRAANRFSPAANGLPLTANRLSSAARGFPLAANQLPRAANQLSLAADRLSSAAGGFSRAADRLPLAAKGFSPGVNRPSRAAGRLGSPAAAPREGRGRPPLGVVAPEVTAGRRGTRVPVRGGYGSRLLRVGNRRAVPGIVDERPALPGISAQGIDLFRSMRLYDPASSSQCPPRRLGRPRGSRLFENLNRRGPGVQPPLRPKVRSTAEGAETVERTCVDPWSEGAGHGSEALARSCAYFAELTV